ncbi:MAG: hypothetical protein H0X26_06940 [Alphaproteobacteria bacterium]|nr:hypothetical protein [Alphaproteobacteria bacterium]
MKLYFFLTALGFLMNNQTAFSEDYTTETPQKAKAALHYPAIKISPKLAQQIFIDRSKRLFNCVSLFDNSINYPSGTAIALCDDAQLACLRYGILLKEIENSKGKALEDLQRILVWQKQEVTIRLRGCELGIKISANGGDIMDAAGYPTGSYGVTTPQAQ